MTGPAVMHSAAAPVQVATLMGYTQMGPNVSIWIRT